MTCREAAANCDIAHGDRPPSSAIASGSRPGVEQRPLPVCRSRSSRLSVTLVGSGDRDADRAPLRSRISTGPRALGDLTERLARLAGEQALDRQHREPPLATAARSSSTRPRRRQAARAAPAGSRLLAVEPVEQALGLEVDRFAIGRAFSRPRLVASVTYDRRGGPEEPSELPIFELPLAIVPGEQIPLHIFEERYRPMIGHCLEDDAPFGIVFRDDSAPARSVARRCRRGARALRRRPPRIVVTGGEPFRVIDASTPPTGRRPRRVRSRRAEPSRRRRARCGARRVR